MFSLLCPKNKAWKLETFLKVSTSLFPLQRGYNVAENMGYEWKEVMATSEIGG